jgi:hypothetical protein
MDGDWARAMQSLSDDGWARLPGALDDDLAGRLAAAAPGPWEALPPEEGVVRQGGFSCGAEFEVAPDVVRRVGDEITSSLGAPTSGVAAEPARSPSPVRVTPRERGLPAGSSRRR